MKFFQTSLGAARNVSEKDDKFLIMGTHDEERLTQELYNFITKYVLCPKCRNPETAVKMEQAKKGVKFTMQCGACGQESNFDEHDRTFTFFRQYYEKHPEEATVAKHAAQAKKEDAVEQPAAEVEVVPVEGAAKKKREKVAKKSDLETSKTDPRKVTAAFMAKGDYNTEKLHSFIIDLKNEAGMNDENIPLILIGAIKEYATKENFFQEVRRHADVLRMITSVRPPQVAGEVIGDRVRAEYEKTNAKIQRYFLFECAKICQDYYKEDTDKLALLIFMLYLEDIVNEASIAAFVTNKKLADKVERVVEVQTKIQKILNWMQPAPTQAAQ
ncbi:translation initiation factor 5 [Strigomonas culicis]|nr:translation initiation factor 5 [Strigomonas culicis]|eukprot:EPY24123.1 translation initiation factor 5 [Strigomonas culicis]